MPRGLRLALFAAAGFAFMAVAPARAQQTVKREPIKPIVDISGAATFNAYCTPCHGTSGRGNGPAAKALVKPPADLTQIAKGHGGTFPAASVRMTITGETEMASHGTRDMPMWGPLFRSVEGDSTAMLRLRNLVGYIEALQEK